MDFRFRDKELDKEEGEFCKRAFDELQALSRRTKGVTGVQGLLKSVGKLSFNPACPKSILFELQIAYDLLKAGVAIRYHAKSINNSLVEFQFRKEPYSILIEAVAMGVSDREKKATRVCCPIAGVTESETQLSGGQLGEEMIRVQHNIGEKVFDQDKEVKFGVPLPNDIHIIMVDMRCFCLGRGGDRADHVQLLYGPKFVRAEEKCWIEKTEETKGETKKRRQVVLGLWERDCPGRPAGLLRDRVHFICLSNREDFERGLFEAPNSYFFANPHLFPDGACSALEKLASIPGLGGASVVTPLLPRRTVCMSVFTSAGVRLGLRAK